MSQPTHYVLCDDCGHPIFLSAREYDYWWQANGCVSYECKRCGGSALVDDNGSGAPEAIDP